MVNNIIDSISRVLGGNPSAKKVSDDLQMTSELILLVRMMFADGELRPEDNTDQSKQHMCLSRTNSKADPDKKQLLIGKLVIPVISLLALAFAWMEFSMIAILSVAASVGLVLMVPATIGAFFWRRGTAAGALVSIVGGSIFVVAMYLSGNSLFGLNAGILGFPVATILFIGVSLITSPDTSHADEFMQAATDTLSRKSSP